MIYRKLYNEYLKYATLSLTGASAWYREAQSWCRISVESLWGTATWLRCLPNRHRV